MGANGAIFVSERPVLLRIIRKRDLPAFTGLQRTAIEELIKRGEFPKPFPLSDSGRAVGWIEDEIIAWQHKRLATRDRAANK
jgi:predicted DNA-binding transcriptional regulator AlpA